MAKEYFISRLIFRLYHKIYPDALHFDIHFVKDGSQAMHVPLEFQCSFIGDKSTAVATRVCT